MQPFGSRSVPILGADFRDGHFRQLSTIKFSQIQNKQNCQPTLHGTKNKIKAIQLYQPKAKLFPRSKGSDEMADQDTAVVPWCWANPSENLSWDKLLYDLPQR